MMMMMMMTILIIPMLLLLFLYYYYYYYYYYYHSQVIASSQKAFKSMDGAAHQLYSYTKSRVSPREWSLLDYSRASESDKLDRLKIHRKAKV